MGGHALAQGEIPAAVRRAGQLAPDQAALIAEFVKTHAVNLGASKDPQLIKKDREALLVPLTDPLNTPAFRLKFSEELVPTLKKLADDPNEIVVINALRLAGDLATAQSVDLVKSAASAQKPAIRYAAAFALRRTFEALGKMQAPTIRQDQADDAVRFIGKRLTEEKDALVIDGLVLAGIEASRVPVHRALALMNLSTGVSAVAKEQGSKLASEPLAQALLRCGTGVRDALSAAQPGQIPSEALKAAAELGGRLISYCVQAVEIKALPLTDKALREIHAQIATTGETIVLLAATLQGANAPQSRNMGSKIKNASIADDAAFGVDARTLVGRDGVLSKDPFKFPADAFLAK